MRKISIAGYLLFVAMPRSAGLTLLPFFAPSATGLLIGHLDDLRLAM